MTDYAPTTIRQYRSRRKLLKKFIDACEAGAELLTLDELTRARLEVTELELKLGPENLGEIRLGRPRTKMTLRGEALKEYERLQQVGVVKEIDYSPEATTARARARLASITPEAVEGSAFALEQMNALAEGERKRKEEKKAWEREHLGQGGEPDV